MAGVGPLTSLVLGGVFTLVAWLLHGSGVGGVVVAALAWLGGINILLAVFNVIPAAPLDGGRLLQAVLWAITKDRLKAAMWAARSGQVFGWALLVVGAYLVLARRDYSWLWFIISAGPDQRGHRGEPAGGGAVPVAHGGGAGDHDRRPGYLPALATVTRFLQELLPWLRHSAFPVVDDGQTVGLVTVRRVNQVPATQRDRTTLREVACPLAEVARATPDEPVADLLPRLNACSDGRALVFADGQLAGIVAPADISRALERISGNRSLFGSAGRWRTP